MEVGRRRVQENGRCSTLYGKVLPKDSRRHPDLSPQPAVSPNCSDSVARYARLTLSFAALCSTSMYSPCRYGSTFNTRERFTIVDRWMRANRFASSTPRISLIDLRMTCAVAPTWAITESPPAEM